MTVLQPRQPLITLVPRVTVTQIIVRPSTTLTAVVTLGNDLNTQAAAPPPAAETLPTIVAPTTSSQPLTNEALGAILGSVFGFLFIVLPLAYICLRRPTWRRRRYREWSSSSSNSGDSRTSTEMSENRPRRGPRGPPPRDPRGDPRMRMPAPFMPVLIPPPARIPPKRHAPYRHTSQPQIPGVRVYP